MSEEERAEFRKELIERRLGRLRLDYVESEIKADPANCDDISYLIQAALDNITFAESIPGCEECLRESVVGQPGFCISDPPASSGFCLCISCVDKFESKYWTGEEKQGNAS